MKLITMVFTITFSSIAAYCIDNDTINCKNNDSTYIVNNVVKVTNNARVDAKSNIHVAPNYTLPLKEKPDERNSLKESKGDNINTINISIHKDLIEDEASDDKKSDDIYEKYSTIINGFLGLIGVLLTIYFASWREKGNIIRRARIEWAQILRSQFAEFTSLAQKVFIQMRSEYAEYLENNKSVTEENKNTEIRRIVNSYANKIAKIKGLRYSIILHLNPYGNMNGNTHEKLKKYIEDISDNLSYDNIKNNSFETDMNSVVNEAAIVIKEAWEQAKEAKIFK